VFGWLNRRALLQVGKWLGSVVRKDASFCDRRIKSAVIVRKGRSDGRSLLLWIESASGTSRCLNICTHYGRASIGDLSQPTHMDNNIGVQVMICRLQQSGFCFRKTIRVLIVCAVTLALSTLV